MDAPDLSEFDAAYRARLASGQMRWHPGAYEDFDMRPYLEKWAARLAQGLAGLRVLDLGCGTGQISAYLAERGASVTGVDASPAAIDFARRKAEGLALPIEFLAGDLRTLALPAYSFDLAIDCQFMHCIVSPAERSLALERICAWLKPGGELWSETMIGIPRIRSGDGYFLDEDGVFWKALGEDLRYPQSVARDGRWYSPIRRIWPEAAVFNRELERAGFSIEAQELEAPADDASVSMLRTRAHS